jgi:hypothetical protein
MKVDELERLERAATPGRHTTGEAEHDAIPYVGIGYTDEVYALDSADPHESVATFERPEDAALYAAARNALPALLRAIKAGRECADDLESVLRARYEGTLDYPSQAQRFERDMEPVRALRAALAALEGTADA